MNNVDQDSQGHLYVLSPRGYSAYEIAVQQGFVGTEDEWLASLVGPEGPEGPEGKSAYEVAVENGYIGSEEDWVNDFLTPDGYYNKGEVDYKINAQLEEMDEQSNQIEQLVGRMDEFTNLPEGSTTGDAELADIRVDINGNSYDNAGNAVRGQISSISEFTRNLNKKPCGRYKANSTTGVISSANTNNYGMSDKIECSENTEYAISFKTNTIEKMNVQICFYDENEDFLPNTRIASNMGSADMTSCVIKTPVDANYLYVHLYCSAGISVDDTSGISIQKTALANKYIPYISATDYVSREGSYVPLSITENEGYIKDDGTIGAQSSTYKDVYTQKFELSLFNDIQIDLSYTETRNMWIVYALYDEDENFIERNMVLPTNLSSYREYGVTFIITNASAKYIAFSYRKYDDGVFSLKVTPANNYFEEVIESVNNLDNRLTITTNMATKGVDGSIIGLSPIRFKPCIDHLFVGDTSDAIIPHESIYHIRLSRLLGFDVIEGNVKRTSDGVFIVNHLMEDKFGTYFHHVDGVTDISDIAIDTVTWDWIVQNVRYNSTIPKYRTRPCTLEEFLKECRQQNIIPLVTTDDDDAIAIIDGIMGINNYIAYNGTREKFPTAIITHWKRLSTKQKIVDYCESIGKPFIYSMANPTDFTDEQLQDIINTLHKKGYWISTAYNDSIWYKYSYMGFDLNGSRTRINRITDGNICNLDTTFNFDDFVYTNASEEDGVLTYNSQGTFKPNIIPTTVTLGGIDIEISFIGEIRISAIGKQVSTTYTSDGSIPVFLSTVVLNGNIVPNITVESGTIIKDAKFKASKF